MPSVSERFSDGQSIVQNDQSIAQLRENLIDLTVALADELAQDGDTDRLAALAALYQTTRDALAARDLRGVR